MSLEPRWRLYGGWPRSGTIHPEGWGPSFPRHPLQVLTCYRRTESTCSFISFMVPPSGLPRPFVFCCRVLVPPPHKSTENGPDKIAPKKTNRPHQTSAQEKRPHQQSAPEKNSTRKTAPDKSTPQKIGPGNSAHQKAGPGKSTPTKVYGPKTKAGYPGILDPLSIFDHNRVSAARASINGHLPVLPLKGSPKMGPKMGPQDMGPQKWVQKKWVNKKGPRNRSQKNESQNGPPKIHALRERRACARRSEFQKSRLPKKIVFHDFSCFSMIVR